MISHYRSLVDRWMGGLHGDWETDYRDTTQLFSLFKLKSVNGCRPNDVHPGRQAVSERFYWLCDTPNERFVVMNQLAVKSNNCWWPFVHWKAADGLDGRILMQWRGQLYYFSNYICHWAQVFVYLNSRLNRSFYHAFKSPWLVNNYIDAGFLFSSCRIHIKLNGEATAKRRSLPTRMTHVPQLGTPLA